MTDDEREQPVDMNAWIRAAAGRQSSAAELAARWWPAPDQTDDDTPEDAA